jgi:citrate synthase
MSRGGLDEVVAVRTRLSEVDGVAGELIIAGHRVEVLAANHGFEEVCHLLWHGELPAGNTVGDMRARLGRKRGQVYRQLAEDNANAMHDPMEAIRSALARLPSTDDLVEDATMMVAAVPMAAAAWWSARRGLPAPAPREDLSTAADYLRMITGRDPEPIPTRALEQYLVTVSEHGMNASTFTARVIASTRSDLISAVVGAVGALKGPLHGGAPGPVLDMLDAIGSPAHAEAWLRRELEANRRIMGMGHRVYRVRDPRAAVFERAVAEQAEPAEGVDGRRRLELARSVEQTAEAVLSEKYAGRHLKANVEFYTAVLLEAVGVPRELFTATFAVGRMAGWTAHVMEQRAEDRLIRPRSEYAGPRPPERPADPLGAKALATEWMAGGVNQRKASP